jgi:hypothetical protein
MERISVPFRFSEQTSIVMNAFSPRKSKLIENIAKELLEVKD